MTDREAFEEFIKQSEHIHVPSAQAAWQAACAWQRERDAEICDAMAEDHATETNLYSTGVTNAATTLSDKIRSAE